MQIKTTTRYHFMPTRLDTINTSKCWREHEEFRTLIQFWWACKLVQSLWKTVWQFLKKLNIELPYDSATPLLGIQPRKTKTYVHTRPCTRMFTVALYKPKSGNNSNVHQLINGYSECGIAIPCNSIRQCKGMKY